MALSPVVSWVTLCALVLCIVSAFAAEEIVIVPQVNDAYMLFQSSTEAGRSDTRPLLIGTGGYSSGGATVGSITYDFRHSLRLSRIELITDQIGTGLTTHRIESGYYSINTFIYEFNGATSSGQVLSFTFPNNTMARMLRINTLKSMGGVNWSKVTVWGWSEQMVPTPPPAFNFRISTSSSDYGTYPDQLLFGTGAWTSGKVATTSSKVYVEYDFNQLSTRIDTIQLTCSQATQGTTSHRIMGGAPGSLKDLFLWTGVSKDNDVITIPMNGTQMRALRISTENSAGNIHGWKSIKVFTAKSSPGLLFEPNTWGTTYMGYKDTPYNVVAPPVAMRATVFAFGGGGGGNNLTGNPGGGAYVAGNITNLNDLQFYVGGMGGTGAAGNGHNNFNGGEGGMSYSSSVSAGGGGGGGTFIKAGGNIIMVVGGGGGPGASFTVNNGGNGGHGGYFTASGAPIIGSGTRGQSNGGNFYFGGIGGQGGAYSTNTGQTGQSYGGGGGGGGYPGGLGGGTLNAQTVVAAGAGGGGASAILSPADFSGTFSSINLGGMPGAIQLVWEYTTIHFAKFSSWGPDVAMNCPIILGVVAGTVTAFPAPKIPVRYTIYGDTASFSDGSSVCDTLTTTDAAYSCPIIAFAPGHFRVAAQTPLSFSGGYLLYAENFNAVPGAVCAS